MFDVTLPNEVVYDKDICIICLNSDIQDSILQYNCIKNIETSCFQCPGCFLHQECLSKWIKINKTNNLKCLSCHTNYIEIPTNLLYNELQRNDIYTPTYARISPSIEQNSNINRNRRRRRYVLVNPYNFYNSRRSGSSMCIACLVFFIFFWFLWLISSRII